MSTRDVLVSVVIPTFNQCELLEGTLANLARQRFPAGQFEVIVSDDGSTDDTKTVVNSFSAMLSLKYCFQEDLGFRAAAARNGGARIASAPLLIFLDTGSMVGPDFVARHYLAHDGISSGRAVLGISYGYNPEDPIEGLDEALLGASPETLVAQFRDDPEFQDIRQEDFVACGFDLSTRTVPWMLFWTGNCSIAASDFWQVDGFDENFRGWGGEDIELGYRLYRHGISIVLDQDIWAVVAPHDRDVDANDQALITNMTRFLAKAPEPMVEIGWGVVAKFLIMPWESEYQRLIEWREKSRDLSVPDEVAEQMRHVAPGDRVAIFGCGAIVPAEALPSSVFIDFDDRLLCQIARAGGHQVHHAVGIRTQLLDGAVDTVIITSRLAGLWDTWSEEIQQEAARIGRRVVVFAGA